MALGRYESEQFPYLELRLTIEEREIGVTALIDTGFDGAVAAPEDLITDGQQPDGYKSWALADGSVIEAPIFAGTAKVGGFPPIPVDIVALGEEPLVGRRITDHYRVTLDHGERVIVEL